MYNRKNCLFFVLLFFLGLTVNPAAAEDFLEKGIKEYRAENYEEAIDIFKKAKEQQPDSSIAAFYLGLTYKQMGNYREAAKNFRDALTLTLPVNDAYAELIEVLYSLNELQEAKDWIAKAKKENIKPANIAFLEGMVLLKENRNKEAIDAFKKAKELDKSLEQASEFQIAMALAKERRLSEAKDALKAVISVDPATEIASFAKEYEKSIAKVLEMYRPWRFAVGIAYQYDDNVLTKPSSAITGVDITGEKDSGMINTFRIDYSPMMSGQWSFAGQFSFYANTYRTTNTHNVIAPTISLIPGYNFQKGAITLPLSYSHIWLKEREYMSVISVRPILSMILLPGHIGQISAGYTKREMLQAPISIDEDRDGSVYSISAGYLYPFSERRGMFNLRYEHSKDDANGINWDNTGNRLSIGLMVPLTSKVNLSVAGDMFLQHYENTHTAFGVKRRDNTYSGSAGIIWELTRGLNLNLQYSHTRADSNIAVYDYKRNVYMAGIEYSF